MRLMIPRCHRQRDAEINKSEGINKNDEKNISHSSHTSHTSHPSHFSIVTCASQLHLLASGVLADALLRPGPVLGDYDSALKGTATQVLKL